MAEWDPERTWTAEEVRRLIEDQFPVLAPCRPRRLAAGWDNEAWILPDGGWIFRFVRRKLGIELMRAEIAYLSGLSRHLPVPDPIFVGESEDGWPFSGYRALLGTPACEIEELDRAALAPALGSFLRVLHHLPVPAGLPPDTFGRSDPPRRLRGLLERGERDPELMALLLELSTTPTWQEPPVWVHGDLYARHVLVKPFGVIDWGDMHAGDPALDLSIAWALLPASAHEEFRSVYGPIDEATWARARFVAARYALILGHYAKETGAEDAARAARWARSGVMDTEAPRSFVPKQ